MLAYFVKHALKFLEELPNCLATFFIPIIVNDLPLYIFVNVYALTDSGITYLELSKEYLIFSEGVTHSKFSARLSVLIPFI